MEREDHGEASVSVGTAVATGGCVAVATGGCVAVATGGWVAVSVGGMNTAVSVGRLVLVGITTPIGVEVGTTCPPGGTYSAWPVCRVVEVPRQLACCNSATVTP